MEENKWSSRKLIFSGFIIACATFLAYAGIISGDTWVTVAGAIGAAYQVGNGLEHLAKR